MYKFTYCKAKETYNNFCAIARGVITKVVGGLGRVEVFSHGPLRVRGWQLVAGAYKTV